MVKIRMSGTTEEIKKIIRSFEETYVVKYVSKDYDSSRNPKYRNSKEVRIYFVLGLKD